MEPIRTSMPAALVASPPADVLSLPLCLVDETELPPKTLPIAPSSPAPILWVNAAYDDDDESDVEVLAPQTPPAATMTANVDALGMLLAASCAQDGVPLSKLLQQLGCSVQVGGGSVLAPEATPAAAFPPTASASGPVSMAFASADDEEDDKEELASQSPPAAPSLMAPSAVPQPASWAKAVDEDEALQCIKLSV
jgi:hypothetical protein